MDKELDGSSKLVNEIFKKFGNSARSVLHYLIKIGMMSKYLHKIIETMVKLYLIKKSMSDNLKSISEEFSV